ncbi:hypothetical protein F2Q68_00018129 [Brassica cretica]|uniref:Uncharacterized protein n=1 Tax=Brassica cretica TaxID=69181 RepID=A0A8S9HM29_BRACR|nr:hypothetical protein F2Q68_00018129 [Brassica cretica]
MSRIFLQGGVWRVSLGWLLSSVLSSSFISAVVEVEWNAGFQWGCSSASCYDLLSSPVFKEDASLSAAHDPEQDREVIAIDLGFSSRLLRRLTTSCLRRGYSLQAQSDQIWFPDLGQGVDDLLGGVSRVMRIGALVLGWLSWQLDFFWLGSNGGLRITLVSLTSVIGFSRLRYSGDDTQRTDIRGNERKVSVWRANEASGVMC